VIFDEILISLGGTDADGKVGVLKLKIKT